MVDPDNRPHLVIQTFEGDAHVVPVSLIEDWIEGRRKITDADDWENLIRSILDEWLTVVKEQKNG